MIEAIRDALPDHGIFDYADETDLSWQPTVQPMWAPIGQQVMFPTPGSPKKRYGIGAVNYHTGEVVALVQKRKRRSEVAVLLEQLLAKHTTKTIYIVWDNASTHRDGQVDDLLRAAAGQLVLLYLPTYSPWLNPIQMLWRQLRREVTSYELFETIDGLAEACLNFFDRLNGRPGRALSIIGADSAVSS